MHKAKVTSKGQITIPATVREQLGLKPGDKLVFFPGAEGECRIRRMGSIKDLKGILAGNGAEAPKTNAELEDLMGEIAFESDEATKSGSRTESEGEAA